MLVPLGWYPYSCLTPNHNPFFKGIYPTNTQQKPAKNKVYMGHPKGTTLFPPFWMGLMIQGPSIPRLPPSKRPRLGGTFSPRELGRLRDGEDCGGPGVWVWGVCVIQLLGNLYVYIYIYGGFLKWWCPTTMGFPIKNDHFGVFWRFHHLRKHPYIYI